MSPTIKTYEDGTTPRLCVVGAGMSGLWAAIQLKRKLELGKFVVFERAHDVGGAWLTNTYPGCQTDVTGFAYNFTFEKNPKWSKLNPDRDEFWKYLQTTARKYGIYSKVQFNTAVKLTHWNDDTKTWIVTTEKVDTKEEQVQEFQIVILATGPLREPNYPPQFDSFTGQMMHSAEWNSNIKLENRVVGVVGSGASGVQVISSIAEKVKELVVYMREPNYVFMKLQISVPWIVQLLLTVCPFLLWVLRLVSNLVVNSVVSIYDAGSMTGRAGSLCARAHLWWLVKDKSIRKLLTAKYPLGYKIPAMAYNSYYESFNRPNVRLNTSPISRIEGQNITTMDGKLEQLDVLILCTGFKFLDYFAPIQVIGADGINILEYWKANRPETFYGITCHELPNMFFLLGPHGFSGSSSATLYIECQVNFIIRALGEVMKRNAASIRVRVSAQAESMLEITNAGKDKVFMQKQAPGTSATWMANENGHCVVWPKSGKSYRLGTSRCVNESTFEFTAKGNLNLMRRYKSIEDVV